MAIQRNAPVQKLDDAVEAAIGDDPLYGGLNRKRARMTDGQKKKAARDESRVKVTYDFPPELAALLEKMAHEHGIPENQLAALLVMRGLEAVDEGEIDIRARKVPSRVPRFEFFLDIEPELKKLRQHKRWQ